MDDLTPKYIICIDACNTNANITVFKKITTDTIQFVSDREDRKNKKFKKDVDIFESFYRNIRLKEY